MTALRIPPSSRRWSNALLFEGSVAGDLARWQAFGPAGEGPAEVVVDVAGVSAGAAALGAPGLAQDHGVQPAAVLAGAAALGAPGLRRSMSGNGSAYRRAKLAGDRTKMIHAGERIGVINGNARENVRSEKRIATVSSLRRTPIAAGGVVKV